ncbi:hypothetical protein BS17DRAFT_166695 [Gyrodon lividus]|nr:hypothetical protein BS17DRAFT_166695 [Gyrodon lividus]
MERHRDVVTVETVCLERSACTFCSRRLVCTRSSVRIFYTHMSPKVPHAEIHHAPDSTRPRPHPRRHCRRTMPTTGSIMEVLYPPSYLATPLSLPDPPAYFPGNAPPNPSHEDSEQRTPLIFSRNANVQVRGASPPESTPSEDSLGRVPLYAPLPTGQHNSLLASLDVGVVEEAEPPPVYSRFDDSRPRFPAASDILGPYPHISLLGPSAR